MFVAEQGARKEWGRREEGRVKGKQDSAPEGSKAGRRKEGGRHRGLGDEYLVQRKQQGSCKDPNPSGIAALVPFLSSTGDVHIPNAGNESSQGSVDPSADTCSLPAACPSPEHFVEWEIWVQNHYV